MDETVFVEYINKRLIGIFWKLQVRFPALKDVAD
jgi:hypothetical protein